MIVRFNDLNIHFNIDHINFVVLNLVNERFLRSIPSHSHSNNSYEIHYVPYGYGTAVINGKQYSITPNTLYITGPHVEHSQEPLASDPMVEYCIYLKVTKDKSSRSESSWINPFLNTCFWFGQDTQNMLGHMQQLFYELDIHPTGYQLQIQTLLMQCLIKIIRNYEYSKSNAFRSDIPVPAETSNLFDQKYIVLEECFLYEYRDITLQSLADRLGLSTRQTERLLQEHYGKTFLQKKNEARMSAAAILLKIPDKNITSIALDLGYSSVEHFSNAFRRYYHISAREFRKRADY